MIYVCKLTPSYIEEGGVLDECTGHLSPEIEYAEEWFCVEGDPPEWTPIMKPDPQQLLSRKLLAVGGTTRRYYVPT